MTVYTRFTLGTIPDISVICPSNQKRERFVTNLTAVFHLRLPVFQRRQRTRLPGGKTQQHHGAQSWQNLSEKSANCEREAEPLSLSASRVIKWPQVGKACIMVDCSKCDRLSESEIVPSVKNHRKERKPNVNRPFCHVTTQNLLLQSWNTFLSSKGELHVHDSLFFPGDWFRVLSCSHKSRNWVSHSPKFNQCVCLNCEFISVGLQVCGTKETKTNFSVHLKTQGQWVFLFVGPELYFMGENLR